MRFLDVITFVQWVGGSGSFDLPLYENQGWNHKTSLSFTRWFGGFFFYSKV